MAQILLQNGKSWGVNRLQLNTNFTELYTYKLEASQVLTKTNKTNYTPTLAYHPATKEYADGLRTSWDTVFNPQSITGDVFLRTNHTGNLVPSVITQDSSNRFHTDAQATSWSAKEPAIGTKKTGFNLDTGTIVGTLATGNHTHTKTDVGLGNVDNTSDTAKAVSTLQQAEIDKKLNKTLADFTPQTSPPAHLEGRTFYEDEHHSLSYHTDISGVTINAGQEMVMRVINQTGSTITNGYACRHDGVDSGTGLPKITLSLADTIEHSRVLGVATSSIAHGDPGFLTTFGIVHDANTAALAVGVPMYLSDTIPGQYTTTAPALITQVGGVLVSDVSGEAFVSIINHIALPTFLGLMQTSSDTPTLTVAFQTIANYATSANVGIGVNATTGIFTIPNTGWYRATITATISSTEDPPSGSHTVEVRLRNTTAPATEGSTTITIPSTSSAGDPFSRSASFLFEAVAADAVEFQIGSADHTGTITFDSLSVDIESKNIR